MSGALRLEIAEFLEMREKRRAEKAEALIAQALERGRQDPAFDISREAIDALTAKIEGLPDVAKAEIKQPRNELKAIVEKAKKPE
jgi:hypothetical protein